MWRGQPGCDTPSGGWLSSSPVIPSLGFCINTRLQISWVDESLPGGLAPGKRPSTTLSPSMALRDGQLHFIHLVKDLDAPYEAGRRAMVKVKRERTVDCVVGGFRVQGRSKGEARSIVADARAVAQAGAFSVVERSRLEHVLREQDLGASGRVRQGTEAEIGELTGAQYLVMGTITSYDENARRTGGGGSIGNIKTPKPLRNLPGIGSRSRVGGDVEVKEAYVAVDLRVVNSTTGELAFVRTVEGHTSDRKFGLRGATGHVSGNFFRDDSTPAGQAVRAAIIEITDYLECAMVIRGACMAEYDAKEDTRRERTRTGELLQAISNHRSVLVVDAGEPRNTPAEAMHAFLSRDGMAPAEFLALGRAEVAGYGGEVESGHVVDVERGGSAVRHGTVRAVPGRCEGECATDPREGNGPLRSHVRPWRNARAVEEQGPARLR